MFESTSEAPRVRRELPKIWERAEISEQLVETIRRRFGLGRVESFSDLGGMVNLNIRLDTTEGCFVARVRRGWVTRARLRWQRNVADRLVAAGVPAVTPIGPAIEFCDRLIELEPFVEHEQADVGLGEIAHAWEVLGRLHSALEGLGIHRPLYSTYCPPPRLNRWLERSMATVSTPEAKDICLRAQRVARLVTAWWRRRSQSLPRTTIHGDYHGSNLLFRKGKVIAVLDFDFSGYRPRAFDLAYGFMFGLMGYGRTDRLASRDIDRLLGAYQSTARILLTDAERAALPWLTAMAAVYWIAEAHFLSDPTAEVLNEDGLVSFAESIASRGDLP